MSYAIHPDAALFPLMSDNELAELVADIGRNGLLHPLMLDPAGAMLVDGRNRDRACEIAGIEPRYERLPMGTDVFTYIVSTNLHRRHLSATQKAAIVKQLHDRGRSGREIAKIANVSNATVSRIINSSPVTNVTPESKKTGADGKSYPANGKISCEQKDAIIASLKANPYGQKAIAEAHGVSVGTVAGIKRKLREAKGLYPKTPPMPTIAEQIARRSQLPRFDSLSREELGMGSKEHGAEQHPDYPPGWTRDDAFRVENGRIPLGTAAERAKRQITAKWREAIAPLLKLDPAELWEIDSTQREQILTYLRKTLEHLTQASPLRSDASYTPPGDRPG